MFFPGMLVGPNPSYSEYSRFISADSSYFLPMTLVDYLSEIGLFCSGAFASTFLKAFIDPRLIHSDEFVSRSIPYQMYYIYVYSIFFRFRYMSVWGLNSLSTNVAGIRSVDKQGKLGKRIRAINWAKVELQLSTRDRIGNWNSAITNVLNFCFYEKFISVFKCSKGLAASLTFGASALLHGSYPAYYIAFFLWQTVMKSGKSIYRARETLTRYKMYKVCLFFEFFLMNVPGIVFSNLLIPDTLRVSWNLRYWFAFIMLFWGILCLVGGRLRKKSKSK